MRPAGALAASRLAYAVRAQRAAATRHAAGRHALQHARPEAQLGLQTRHAIPGCSACCSVPKRAGATRADAGGGL